MTLEFDFGLNYLSFRFGSEVRKWQPGHLRFFSRLPAGCLLACLYVVKPGQDESELVYQSLPNSPGAQLFSSL